MGGSREVTVVEAEVSLDMMGQSTLLWLSHMPYAFLA